MIAGSLAISTLLQAAPNIIFVLTDDLGYGDLGVLFQNNRTPTDPAKKISTPFLDSMAGEGMGVPFNWIAPRKCQGAQ